MPQRLPSRVCLDVLLHSRTRFTQGVHLTSLSVARHTPHVSECTLRLSHDSSSGLTSLAIASAITDRSAQCLSYILDRLPATNNNASTMPQLPTRPLASNQQQCLSYILDRLPATNNNASEQCLSYLLELHVDCIQGRTPVVYTPLNRLLTPRRACALLL